MVQRKAPIKLGSLTEPKKSHVLSEKCLSSNHPHDARNKAGGDLKKIMKKSRSIKASELESLTSSPFRSRKIQINKPPPHMKPSTMKTSNGSPNYMKPTSSSDARKERLQVTFHSPSANDKSKSPKNSNNSNYSRPPFPPADTGIKRAKTLTRKSSLRPKRPSMKKSSGMVLCHKKNVNRATCSSTLKDSKFPKVLDLNPGGTESEGTSIMKVCPYTYCSLNGHEHESLPPLKRFLSARRRLLKTQKSMKLKGLSSFRKRSLRKGRGAERINISSTPSELKVTSLMEDAGNDFFVEIFAKPKEPIREVVFFDERRIQEDCSKENAEILNNLSSMEEDWDWESSELEAEEGDVRIRSNQVTEIYLEISFGGGLDLDSESVDEMDSIMSFLDSAECNQQAEAKKENLSCFLSEDYDERGFECCMDNDLENTNEGLTESGENISTTKTTDMDSEEKGGAFADNNTDNSEYLRDGFGLILGPSTRNENKDDGFLLEPAYTSITSEEGKVAEKCDAAASECGALEGNFNDETWNMPHDLINNELIDVLGQQESLEEDCLGDVLLMSNENIYDSEECRIQDSEIFQGQPLHAAFKILGCDTSEPVDLEGEENLLTADGSLDKPNLNTNVKEERNGNGMQSFDNLQRVGEIDQNNMETDHVQSELEIEEPTLVDATEDSSVPPEIGDSFIFKDQLDESNLRGTEEQEKGQQEENCILNVLQIEAAVRFDLDENGLEADSENPETDSSNQPFPEASSKQKDRYRYSPMRRRTTKDLEEIKQFNPRAPRFLPMEPDPEAEKVDLRHQMMDERKNAESWMMDYALQRLVTRLTPARKRKVALLVEAFETVMPLPMCESPLQSPTSAFAIQACS
ncbi:putative calmodulin binding protein PICBP [Cocos nucifera]|nr:putative calmodulin binding protein PICBP [Cocos nucifera]